MSKTGNQEIRAKRKKRSREKVHGTLERPRLCVFRSTRNVYLQVIDDEQGKTLLSLHSFKKGRASVPVCKDLGKEIATLCKSKQIHKIVFDKNGFDYHGRIKAVAEGAREGGLDF